MNIINVESLATLLLITLVCCIVLILKDIRTKCHMRQLHQSLQVAHDLVMADKEKIEYQERFYRQVFNAVGGLLFVTNEEGEIRLVNESMSKMFGLNPDEMAGRLITDFVSDSNVLRDLQAQSVQVLKRGSTVHSADFRLSDQHGKVHYYSINRRRLVNGKQLVISSATEITNLKATLQALNESEKRLSSMINLVNSLILHIDNAGLIIRATHPSRIFLGREPDACVGLSWFDIFVPNDQPMVKNYFNRWSKIATKKQDGFEASVIRPDGVSYSMLWNVTILYNEFTFAGLYAIAVDITAKKQSETDLIRQFSKYLQKDTSTPHAEQ